MIVWDEAAAVWRDGEGGPEVAPEQVVAARDAIADGYEQRFAELAGLLAAGVVSIDEWEQLFFELILGAVAAGYIFGRGGIALMQPDDWQRVAQAVYEQQRYAEAFVLEVRELADQRGEGQSVLDALQYAEQRIANRSRLYGGNAIAQFEQAQVYRVWRQHLNRSPLTLPVYPTQGSECLMRCRCHWLIVANDEARVWRIRWVTEEDPNVCPTCRRRGEVYRDVSAPYGLPDLSWLTAPTIEEQPVLPAR